MVKKVLVLAILCAMMLAVLSPTMSVLVPTHDTAMAGEYERVDDPEGRWDVFGSWYMLLLYKLGEKVAAIFD